MVGRPKAALTNVVDLWELHEPGGQRYDINRFYTRSSNEHNHQVDVRIRCSPEFNAMVSKMVREKGVPAYRSLADFWRDAAVHRFQYLLDNVIDNPNFHIELTLEMRRDRLSELRANEDRMYELVNDYREQFKVAMERSSHRMMNTLIDYGDHDAPDLIDPYRKQLEALIGRAREDIKLIPRHVERDPDGNPINID